LSDGLAGLAAIGLGILTLLEGLAIGVLNGLFLSSAQQPSTAGGMLVAQIEAVGLIIVGIFGLVLGAKMLKES
jgi:hypothetical protein